MREYRLRCTGCGASFDDDGVQLDCTGEHAPALLRSAFDEPAFRIDQRQSSVLRYRAWLPVGREIASDARPGVYRSRNLAARLGVRELWIAFNGWWPERGASLRTASFKELEATAVLGRLAPCEERTMVVASAGNTAAAFADACAVNDIPILIVVPASAFERVAAVARIGPSVHVVALEGAEYDDAIAFARQLAAFDEFIFEGGVRNVARRDGLGLVLLAAAEAAGALPSAYVQAVGSAAGALGVHEMAARLIADGRFGMQTPRLILAQNAPFTPLHDAWSVRAEILPERSPAEAKLQIAQIGAGVLSNQTPPYTIRGGVREALAASNGSVAAIANTEMIDAMLLFAESEGIDVDPEAGIAIAALVRALADGSLEPDTPVLLNVTGGGRSLRAREVGGAVPALTLRRDDWGPRGHDAVRSLLFSSHR
jgi:cysteate synthase